MITVHHLNQSRSKRILWLLEELDMPYQLVQHQRDPQTHLAPQSLKDIHPLSKAPIIDTGEFLLSESGAIVEYILDQDTQNRLRPARGTQAYYRFQEWMHFAEGSLSLPVITNLFMGMEERSGQQPMDHYISKEIELDFSFIEDTLSKQAYFAGEEFSAADIMMTFMLEAVAANGILDNRPNTQKYLQTVQQREAYQKAAAHG
ncbi:glutathione S-transferase family protein [Bacterioplanoides sp. SCSIO 12839]|uniref:glutathione S-transferase family protein n=1 Tax=Bacterioplanoides sp. SCSIO 12839 TaxID=2829569 RepID=UPI0021033450|nr:glutathione S-transferase [Bacterioplanoides sp. SCSIO 12839]UTW48682.1 glutathione S-transferase [Bacterioplanoides sp. SCSIO 12839]